MITLEIVTPEKILYSDEVDEVIVPTTTGEITILPHHIPLVSQLSEGEVTIKKGGKTDHLAVQNGFIQVSPKKITILADYAIRSEDIAIAKAEEAKKRAEKLMEEKGTEEDFAQAQALFRRSLLELKVANRRHRRSV